ncbi:GNAT family N-acetyltransferase [Yoonia sp. 208BN28-4]|uniref:GNAT family N-acetyltransferase n=1 Tax=Yoonia sp. 208BN28-4 TaxID=3126505 RepID=UPI00309DF310
MTLPRLVGERITLRPMVTSDAAAMFAAMSDWNVVQWLTAPPYPYTLQDADWFIANGQDDAWTIDLAGQCIGSIGDLPELGYWLAPAHHGQGYMTEAARLAVDWHFAQSTDDLRSGHFKGNAASRGVLLKLGFQDTHIEHHFSKPQGKEMVHQCMCLPRDRWHALRNAQQ